MEASLDTRQNVLKRVLDDCRKDHSHVLLDCMPSLGMMTINALAAADSVLIRDHTALFAADGLALMESIVRMRRGLNMGLWVEANSHYNGKPHDVCPKFTNCFGRSMEQRSAGWIP